MPGEPVVGRHLDAANRPPPVSAAVPVIVTGVPTWTTVPAAGEVIVDVGAVVSVEAVAATRPDCSESGCTPMSANRLTVACRMPDVGVVEPPSWLPSSPHDHCTVPAPKTSAPLGAVQVRV